MTQRTEAMKKQNPRRRSPAACALAVRGKGKLMRDRRLRRLKARERRELKLARETE
jgi:hypothetical protein